MSYTGTFSNSIETKENLLFKTKFSKWRNGFKHQLPIGASFNIFKYISISPTFNFNYKWYFSREERSWDEKNQKEIIDTTAGFYNVYDFSLGVSMQTKIYGFYTPIRKFLEIRLIVFDTSLLLLFLSIIIPISAILYLNFTKHTPKLLSTKTTSTEYKQKM